MRRFFFAPVSDPLATSKANSVDNKPICNLALQQQAIGQSLALPDSVYHHWCRVLRAKVGEQSVFFDGLGGEAVVVLDSVDKKSASASIISYNNSDRTAPNVTTIAIVMSRGDRLDYAIQKATELGATAIQLLTSQHSEVRLKPQQVLKKRSHWQQVALSACEQCGLNRPPLILSPLSLAAYLAGEVGQVDDAMQPLLDSPFYQAYSNADALKLILAVPAFQYEDKATSPLASEYDTATPSVFERHFEQHCQSALSMAQPVRFDILIGAEGGLSPIEHTQAYQSGFVAWALGERILRTETAPVVALTLLNLRSY